MATPEEVAEFKRLGREVVGTGEMWFAKLEKELHAKYPGDYTVVINIDDGSYVVGRTELEAVQNAKKEFPYDAKGYVRGIAVRSSLEFGGCPDWEVGNAGIS